MTSDNLHDRSPVDRLPMTCRPLLMTRRAMLAGAAAGAASLWTPRDVRAQTRIDVTQGTVKPMPIALPDFVGGTPNDGEVARNVTQVITANLKRSGLFAPIDQAAYIERITNIDTLPRFPGVAHHRRPGAGDRPHHTAERRPPQDRVPAVGRGVGGATHRPAILHRRRQLAPHRAHHLGRGLSASHRRDGLFRQPRGVRRRVRVRRTSASSGSRSWTRTAPTCAISRAATIWC